VIFDLERQRGRESEFLIRGREGERARGERERKRGWGTSAYRGEREIALFFCSFQGSHVRSTSIREIKFEKIFRTRSSFLAYKYKLNSAFHTYPQIQQKTSLSQFLFR
jgi:hypothetical protein